MLLGIFLIGVGVVFAVFGNVIGIIFCVAGIFCILFLTQKVEKQNSLPMIHESVPETFEQWEQREVVFRNQHGEAIGLRQQIYQRKT